MLSLTGFDVTEFKAFLPAFKYRREEYHSHFTLTGKIRERITYNRKTGKIPLIEDKLLLVLSYLKNNPLQEYHGATCNMSQPQCNEWVHRLSDILHKTLKTLDKLPDRNHLKIRYLTKQYQDILLDGMERIVEPWTGKNHVTAVKNS
ncbi:hypothetical protein Barb4_04531 [Bacteroidales bacterium Barb4]|nr:hypothetical protein Barb4_04531 [Bacteroidales bacterium Barb4]